MSINNIAEELVIDRVRHGSFYTADGKLRWIANHVKDATLEMGGETVYATDELGTNIMGFERSKNATCTFNSAVLVTPILADQMGAELEIASEENKVVLTALEIVKVAVTDGAATATLAHTPYAEVEGVPFKYITKLSASNNKVAEYELGETAAENFSVAGSVITLPTDAGFVAGDRIMVKYKYEATEGVAFNDNYDSHSEYGEFVLQVYGYLKCDRVTKYLINIIFPWAKLDNNVSLNLSNEMSQPVSISAMPDYCAEDKKLYRWEVVGEIA